MNQISNTSQSTTEELAFYQTLIKRQNTKRFKKSKSGLVRASIAVIIAACISFACSYSSSASAVAVVKESR